MNTHSLECFLAVASSASFSRAAQEMFMTQPAMTQVIKNLERDLGVTLFYRDNKRVELTKAGKVLLPEARQMVRMAQAIIQKVKRAADDGAECFTIAYRQYESEVLYAYLMPLFMREHPEAQVTFLDMHPLDTLGSILCGESDVSLLQPDWPKPNPDDMLVYTPVFEDFQCVVMKKDHRLADLRLVSEEMLRGETVLIPEGVPNYMPLRERLERLDPPCICKQVSLNEINSAVRMGLGVGVCLAATRPPEDNLHTALLEGAPKNVACMVTAADAKPIVRAFVEVATRELAEFPRKVL